MKECIKRYVNNRNTRHTFFFIAMITMVASLPYLNRGDIVNKEILAGVLINLFTTAISYRCFIGMFKKQYIGLFCTALYTLSVFRLYKVLVLNDVIGGITILSILLLIYAMYILMVNWRGNYTKVVCLFIVGYAGIVVGYILSTTIPGKQEIIQKNGLTFAQLATHFFDAQDVFCYENGVLSVSHNIGVGLILCMGLFVFMACWFCGVFCNGEKMEVFYAKCMAFAAGCFLLLSTDIIPWNRLRQKNPVVASLLSSLQFPDFFLEWGTACLVFVFGYCLYFFENTNKALFKGMIVLAIVGLTTSSFAFVDAISYVYRYCTQHSIGYISGVGQILSQPFDFGKEFWWHILELLGMLVFICAIIWIRCGEGEEDVNEKN